LVKLVVVSIPTFPFSFISIPIFSLFLLGDAVQVIVEYESNLIFADFNLVLWGAFNPDASSPLNNDISFFSVPP
jgi:hypothetical protein